MLSTEEKLANYFREIARLSSGLARDLENRARSVEGKNEELLIKAICSLANGSSLLDGDDPYLKVGMIANTFNSYLDKGNTITAKQIGTCLRSMGIVISERKRDGYRVYLDQPVIRDLLSEKES